MKANIGKMEFKKISPPSRTSNIEALGEASESITSIAGWVSVKFNLAVGTASSVRKRFLPNKILSSRSRRVGSHFGSDRAPNRQISLQVSSWRSQKLSEHIRIRLKFLTDTQSKASSPRIPIPWILLHPLRRQTLPSGIFTNRFRTVLQLVTRNWKDYRKRHGNSPLKWVVWQSQTAFLANNSSTRDAFRLPTALTCVCYDQSINSNQFISYWNSARQF